MAFRTHILLSALIINEGYVFRSKLIPVDTTTASNRDQFVGNHQEAANIFSLSFSSLIFPMCDNSFENLWKLNKWTQFISFLCIICAQFKTNFPFWFHNYVATFAMHLKRAIALMRDRLRVCQPSVFWWCQWINATFLE